MQPAVAGRVLALVHRLPAFAVVLVAPHPRPQRPVVGGDHAPFPAGGHDLVLAERPAAHMAETAHRAAAPGGAVDLGAVLDQIEAVLLGQRRHGVHVAGPAGQVHAHHRLGGRCQRRRHGLGGDVLAVPVHIREHRARAHIDDSRRGSQESAGSHHHIIPGADPQGPQREIQGHGAISQRHRVLSAGESGELTLKRPALIAGPVVHLIRQQHPLNGVRLFRGVGRPGRERSIQHCSAPSMRVIPITTPRYPSP